MQVIVGLSVPHVRDRFEQVLQNPSAYELVMPEEKTASEPETADGWI